MKELPHPICPLCDAHYHYEGRSAMKMHGTMMYPYECYCIAGKRARRFGGSDPKRKPPTWCPRRKSPCELRIYGFISENERLLHTLLSRDSGDATSPSERRYGLRYEGVTDLTPREFWHRWNSGDGEVALPVEVKLYEVVEIDDGLNPVCFYNSQTGYCIEPFFKGNDARTRKACEEAGTDG